MRDSIIEPSISRDILQLERITKPALLRQLFALACMYSSRILSYQKMLGPGGAVERLVAEYPPSYALIRCF